MTPEKIYQTFCHKCPHMSMNLKNNVEAFCQSAYCHKEPFPEYIASLYMASNTANWNRYFQVPKTCPYTLEILLIEQKEPA